MVRRDVAAVREFNRFWTRQIGVLDEGLLHSDFSLAEARVLYEIANRERPSAGELSTDLRLDAGYLSRILRRFEKDGLVRRETSAADARRSHLTLTAKGKRAFATLDARQNDDVAALLDRVEAGSRRRFVDSLQSIRQILDSNQQTTSEPFILRQHQPGDIGWVTYRHGVLYSREYGYDERFEAMVAKIAGDFIEHLDPARERCWIAERNGEIVGSVFLVKKSEQVAKLRMLYVEPETRGLGIGARLVDECIWFARRARYRKITLWTHSELTAARHIYKKAGFHLVAEEPMEAFSRTDLVSEIWDLDLGSHL